MLPVLELVLLAHGLQSVEVLLQFYYLFAAVLILELQSTKSDVLTGDSLAELVVMSLELGS